MSRRSQFKQATSVAEEATQPQSTEQVSTVPEAPTQESAVTEDTSVQDTPTEVTPAVVDTPVEVAKPIVEKTKVAAVTAEDVFNKVSTEGTTAQKAVLETVRIFTEYASKPYPKGLSGVAMAQSQLSQAVIKAVTTLPQDEMRQLWTAIVHVASKHNHPQEAFGIGCINAAGANWARYGADAYKMYGFIVTLIMHASNKERANKVKDYWNRKHFDATEMPSRFRSNFDAILAMYNI